MTPRTRRALTSDQVVSCRVCPFFGHAGSSIADCAIRYSEYLNDDGKLLKLGHGSVEDIYVAVKVT